MAKVRVYKYYNAEHGRSAILNQRLKITTIDDINDPFEFCPYAIKDQDQRQDYDEMRQSVFSNKGFISFSECRKNPVLWSHYADSHKGICIGFDINDDNHLVPVKYLKNRLPFPSEEIKRAGINANPKILDDMLRTKFTDWRYESERRMYFGLGTPTKHNGQNLYFADFDSDFIPKEIFLGPKYKSITDPNEKHQIKNVLCTLNDCKIVTTRLAFQKYEVVHQQDINKRKSI